jgi:adenylate cyclase
MPMDQSLGELMRARRAPGADVAAIDRRIRDEFEQELCVVFTDMESFSSRSVRGGIISAVSLVYEQREITDPVMAAHGGVVLKSIGDSLLTVFPTPAQGLAAMLELRRRLGAHDHGLPADRHVSVGVGLGFGPVLRVADEDVFGVEVNHASRLGEDMSKAGEIYVTGPARARLGDFAGVRFERVEAPFEAYRVLPEPGGPWTP